MPAINHAQFVLSGSVERIGTRHTSFAIDILCLETANLEDTVYNKQYQDITDAFGGCTNLTSVNIPSSVTEIRNWAFVSCTSLTSINIPSSVTSIGSYAFADCTNLTSVNIPPFVTTIGENAFNGCSNLKTVTLSRRTNVGENTFPTETQISYRD